MLAEDLGEQIFQELCRSKVGWITLNDFLQGKEDISINDVDGAFRWLSVVTKWAETRPASGEFIYQEQRKFVAQGQPRRIIPAMDWVNTQFSAKLTELGKQEQRRRKDEHNKGRLTQKQVDAFDCIESRSKWSFGISVVALVLAGCTLALRQCRPQQRAISQSAAIKPTGPDTSQSSAFAIRESECDTIAP